MRGLRAAVFALTILWPAILGAAATARSGGQGLLSTVIYAAAGRVCHQQPARSFQTADTVWPVCARCSGLYLAAPFGAILGWRRRPRHHGSAVAATAGRSSSDRGYLAIAAVPTAITLAVEWVGIAPVSNLTRFLAALPLGVVVAFVVIALLGEGPRVDQIH